MTGCEGVFASGMLAGIAVTVVVIVGVVLLLVVGADEGNEDQQGATGAKRG